MRSSLKAQFDEALGHKLLDNARAELLLLSQRLNRRQLRASRAIRQAIGEILGRTQMKPFLEVLLQRKVLRETRYARRGRPVASAPLRVVRKTVWGMHVRVDEKALASERRTDGVFPLVCNIEKASKKAVLQIYKYQPYVEKRFSQLKTDLDVAPVYLKKPLRCAALVHAYYVALAVASLMERCVRQGMAREGIRQLPLLPEARATSTPTCPRIMEAFRGVSWHEFRRREETVCFPIELSALQKQLLRLLEVPRELYA